MTKRTQAPRFSLHNAATVAASLVIPVPILVSSGVEAVLDSTNPAGIDITSDSAYFETMLLWGFSTLGVMIVVVAVLFAMLFRRTNDLRTLGLPLAILTLQLLLWVVILLTGNVVNDAEDTYAALGL